MSGAIYQLQEFAIPLSLSLSLSPSLPVSLKTSSRQVTGNWQLTLPQGIPSRGRPKTQYQFQFQFPFQFFSSPEFSPHFAAVFKSKFTLMTLKTLPLCTQLGFDRLSFHVYPKKEEKEAEEEKKN